MLWHYYQTAKDIDTQKYFSIALQLITKIIETVMGIILKVKLEYICEWYKNVKFTNGTSYCMHLKYFINQSSQLF